MHGASVESIEQLGAVRQCLASLRIGEPLARALVHFGPLCFLLLDSGLEEVVRGFRGVGCELVGSPPLRDQAEVVVHFDDDAGLFPCFAFGGILGRGLVRLPATFREDPSTASRGLDEEYIVLVGRKRDDAGDEAFALGAVPWRAVSLTGYRWIRIEGGRA